MDAKRILNFLSEVSKNNNRDWFHSHKDEYDRCKAEFEDGVTKAIAAISQLILLFRT